MRRLAKLDEYLGERAEWFGTSRIEALGSRIDEALSSPAAECIWSQPRLFSAERARGSVWWPRKSCPRVLTRCVIHFAFPVFPVQALAVQLANSPIDAVRPFSGTGTAEFLHCGMNACQRECAVWIVEQWVTRVCDNPRIKTGRCGVIGYPNRVVDSSLSHASFGDAPDESPKSG